MLALVSNPRLRVPQQSRCDKLSIVLEMKPIRTWTWESEGICCFCPLPGTFWSLAYCTAVPPNAFQKELWTCWLSCFSPCFTFWVLIEALVVSDGSDGGKITSDGSNMDNTRLLKEYISHNVVVHIIYCQWHMESPDLSLLLCSLQLGAKQSLFVAPSSKEFSKSLLPLIRLVYLRNPVDPVSLHSVVIISMWSF